jgi:polyisoprenyl-teichoic acid--peptidoglycan teichoic acid transferase
MGKARVEHKRFLWVALICTGISIIGIGIQGCQVEDINKQSNKTTPAIQTESTPTPFLPSGSEQKDVTISTGTNTPTDAYQPIWGTYAPPSIDPATAVPPPLTDLELSNEILVWILLGSDTEPPFIGRTQAIHLLFIHPRFSKVSLVSIPGDLYVYIPGYTMQRLNTAYALGGIETLRETFAYNFGVTPSRFVLAHPGDFQWLIDDVNSLEVTVFYPMPGVCGGIPAGQVTMDGTLALCYASYREGMDEVDRMRRQQQLLGLIFHKLTQDGNLAKLPQLYASYEGWVKTNLSLKELMSYIPLALKLADPDRINTYMIGWDEFSVWEISGESQAQVFLPKRDRIKALLQQAIDDVMVPAPLTNYVNTLESQLTNAVLATPSPTNTLTPTMTPTLSQTTSGTPQVTTTEETSELTPTLTPTVPGYPYP